MIDCTGLADFAKRLPTLLIVAKQAQPPLALRVTDEQAAELVGVDIVEGHAYVDDVPVWILDGERPPPRPVPLQPPVVVDMAVVRAARKVETMEELWSFVDEKISPREREAQLGLFVSAQMRMILGEPVNQWALGVLVFAMGWCKGAMAQQEALSAMIDDAVDADAVAAVVPDFDALGLPPAVTAGQIEAMLAEV